MGEHHTNKSTNGNVGNILLRPTLSNNSVVYRGWLCDENDSQLLMIGLEWVTLCIVGGFICIVGRPLLHKPSTCPQATETRSPCRGDTRQYIVACQAHPALVKIGPVFVPFLFLVARIACIR